MPRHHFFATVTERMKFTIPAELCRRLGLRRGDKIAFIPRPDGRIALRPLR